MTFDSPAQGLVIAQPARGFRYTSDAMWLVGFALTMGRSAARFPANAIDLGTGSGVMAMMLAAQGIDTLGVDHRAEWLPLWEITLARCRTAAPVSLQIADIGSDIAGRFDLVVANPPFFAAGTGPVAPDPWKRAARTESTATLSDFLTTAARLLTDHGYACFIVPREREGEVKSGPLPVVRWLRIGRRRSLFALSHTASAAPSPEEATEDSDLARALLESAAAAGYIPSEGAP